MAMDDPQSAEARMRRALGLSGPLPAQPTQQRPEQARARHRFVQDGEVPVEIVTGSRAPDSAPGGLAAVLQAALNGERTARADAERLLAEAQATIQSLRTKLAHAELAHNEALGRERLAREHAQTARQEAAAARELAEQRLSEITAARAAQVPPTAATAKRVGSAKSASRAPAAKTREPKPVKWWLPSYKTKTKAS